MVTNVCTFVENSLLSVGLIDDNQINFYVQLNKYQTDLYLLELSHQMTNVCLLISDFLPAFDCSCMLGR